MNKNSTNVRNKTNLKPTPLLDRINVSRRPSWNSGLKYLSDRFLETVTPDTQHIDIKFNDNEIQSYLDHGR